MDNCKHVARLSPPSGHSIIDPQHWLCTVCGTTESVWACLSCSNMACGRFNEEHALQHYKKSKHPLALEVNEKYLYCYECDEYVLNDNEAGDVEMLRQALSAVAKQSFQELSSRRKGLLRSHSFAGFEQRGHDTTKLQREDQGYTALKFRRVVLLTKVFQAWYAYAQTSKAARSHRHISKDDLFEASPDSCRRSTRKRKMAIIPGVTGLRNLGNTCYMNSVLQVLSHLQEFRDFFLKCDLSFTKLMHDKLAVKMKLPYQRQTTMECFQEINADGRSTSGVLKGGLNGGGTSHSKARIERLKRGSQCLSLCHELHALLRVMWSGKWALVSPQAILQAIWKIIPFFKGYSQQDAQEFMGEFLDKVQSELETAVPGSSYTHQGSARDIISQTFQGQLVSKVTCLRCGHVSSTFEPFMDLPLEFLDGFQVSTEVSSKSCSLKEMIQKFTSAEKLDGPIYACDGCNRNRRKAANKATVLSEAEKIIHIHKLPPVLRLQLKRFVWSGRNNRGKIGAHVGFPRVLDMAAFCDTGTDSESFRYVLSAAVVHHGRGFGSGHYTAYCWNSRADSWVHCNDSRVELCSLSDVMKCQAYILIYTRCEDFLTLLDASDSYLTLNSLFEQEIDPEVTFNYRNSTIPRFMDLKRRLVQDSDAKPQLKRRRTVT